MSRPVFFSPGSTPPDIPSRPGYDASRLLFITRFGRPHAAWLARNTPRLRFMHGAMFDPLPACTSCMMARRKHSPLAPGPANAYLGAYVGTLPVSPLAWHHHPL